MYNRYVPQPDGSFHRSRVGEPQISSPRNPSQPRQDKADCSPEQPKECPPVSVPCPSGQPERVRQDTHRRPPVRPQRNSGYPGNRPCGRERNREQATDGKSVGVTDFLKSLLPKDFDTGDLLIVLLLLLMSGDCAEDQNTALLTLVLYLFL